MKLRVGDELQYAFPQPTRAILMLNIHFTLHIACLEASGAPSTSRATAIGWQLVLQDRCSPGKGEDLGPTP